MSLFPLRRPESGRLVLVERPEGKRTPRTFWALKDNFRVLSSRPKSLSSATGEVGAVPLGSLG